MTNMKVSRLWPSFFALCLIALTLPVPAAAQSNPCPDAWVTAQARAVTGITPVGAVCNHRLYGDGYWESETDLNNLVRVRMGMCSDMWVTQAVIQVYGRPPLARECDIRLYGGGRWSDWSDLLSKVKAANLPTTPLNNADFPLAKGWRVLVLVYRNTNLDKRAFPSWLGKGNFTASMNQDAMNRTTLVAKRLRETVRSWSGGLADVMVDVQFVDRAINSLTLVNGVQPDGSPIIRYWVTPKDAKPEIDRYAPSGRYDSIITVWRADNDAGDQIPVGNESQGAWGLAIGPSAEANGAGYASIPAPPRNGQWSNGREGPAEEIFVHEWLHQVEGFYRGKYGVSRIPNGIVDSAGSHGYASEPPGNGTWKRFLSDFMQGRVGGRYGVTRDMWSRGGPRTYR